MSNPNSSLADERLAQLESYLAADPDNAELLAFAATEALRIVAPQQALRLLNTYGKSGAPTAPLGLLRGVTIYHLSGPGEALGLFTAIAEAFPASEEARTATYMSARCLYELEDFEAAFELLDAFGSRFPNPEAAELFVRAGLKLHRPSAVLETGRAYLQRSDAHPRVLGLLSGVALDEEDSALARQFAEAAGDDGLAKVTWGFLCLEADRTEEAERLFSARLAEDPQDGRACIGSGVCALIQRDYAKAAVQFDTAAHVFQTHLGAWIAAGWMDLVQDRAAAARAKFEVAADLEPGFAEAQGALAVCAILEGDVDGGRRRTEIALRLDRRCLSGALARTLLLTMDGKADAAQALRQRALEAPLNLSGRSIFAFMQKFGWIE